jgi:hypothetical protein
MAAANWCARSVSPKFQDAESLIGPAEKAKAAIEAINGG